MSGLYSLYRGIFIGGLVLSIVMLAVAVLIFFLLDIRRVWAEYNGSARRKAIEKIQKHSTGDYTDKVAAPAVPAYENGTTGNPSETAKIKPQDRYDSFEAGETTTLNEGGTETTVLNAAPETVQPAAPTTQATPVYSAQPVQYADFVIETDITYVHSNEIIRG